jgi:hypothetical protein
VLTLSGWLLRNPSMVLDHPIRAEAPFSDQVVFFTSLCWIAGRRYACLGGSIQSHKNKDSLYGRRSLESGMSRYNPVKGLGSWLTPDLYRIGGALGYKAVGRAHIYDRTTINTIKLPSCLYALPVNLDICV